MAVHFVSFEIIRFPDIFSLLLKMESWKAKDVWMMEYHEKYQRKSFTLYKEPLDSLHRDSLDDESTRYTPYAR